MTKSAFRALPLVAANFPPLVAALAATADGELPRSGKGGSMSFLGAAPVKKSKHKAHRAVIDASGGSLTKSAFCALPFGDGRANGTCRECDRPCARSRSLCFKGTGCDAPQTWLRCDECDKWRKVPHGRAAGHLQRRKVFTCSMDIDKTRAACHVAEEQAKKSG